MPRCFLKLLQRLCCLSCLLKLHLALRMPAYQKPTSAAHPGDIFSCYSQVDVVLSVKPSRNAASVHFNESAMIIAGTTTLQDGSLLNPNQIPAKSDGKRGLLVVLTSLGVCVPVGHHEASLVAAWLAAVLTAASAFAFCHAAQPG